MSNTITHEQGNFSTIPNQLLNDSSVSLTAKGLYVFMRGKPPLWNFTIRSMAKQLKEGETAIGSALNELKDSGWISYTKHSNGKGVYHLFWSANANTENPNQENPNQGNPMKGKPQRISKKEPIVKQIIEKQIIKEPLSSKPDRVDEIIDYVNQQAGTGFKHAKSHQRLINARLKEGHTVEDIKTVVDRKVTEWANTRMAKYLRPSTLFSDTNFNNYIGQITVGSDHEGNQKYNNQLTAEQERRARLSKLPAGRIQLQIEDRLAAEQRRDSILVVDDEQDIRPSLDFQSGRRD